MSLNTEQQKCFDAFIQGHSIVVTGPAGCGKSYLVKKIKEHCHDNMINVSITALTGAAASLIGGVTLHGWAGIGLGKGSSKEIYSSMQRYRKPNIKKWYETSVLVIDEISMMDAALFNKLHLLGQIIRKDNDSLFGGIQLILCGDFAQLKPIVDRNTRLKFAFESATWQKYLNNNTYYLDTIVRQTDPIFQKLLGRIRLGGYTQADRTLLNTRLISDESEAEVTVIMDDKTENIIKATRLYPKKRDVDRDNTSELNKLIDLGNSPKTYISYDTAIAKKSRQHVNMLPKHTKILDACTNAPSTVILCIGAQVMLIKNKDMEKQLVNGSRGVVIDIDGSGLPIVLFDNGEQVTIQEEIFETESGDNIFTRKQLPLILAWALTIHKCQGATLSNVITDLAEVFDEAQVYVTLSRAKSIEGLFIVNLNYSKIKCNQTVKKYYTELQSKRSNIV
uniref:AAA+ ATPase domain-containing protein n=1 Tax=viral metagenome TaxID=1070528 RepID=A0A6C0J4S3_9ZZZZ